MKCVPGCKCYDGGEVYHHKSCPFYDDSMSLKYDRLKDIIVWAVTHYGLVNTDGIIKELKKVYMEVEGVVDSDMKIIEVIED